MQITLFFALLILFLQLNKTYNNNDKKQKKKWFYYNLAIVLYIGIAASCSKNSRKITPHETESLEKVLNGTEAKIEEFPFVVSVRSGFICTGSIINESWILTAAHCENGFEVLVGSDGPCGSGGISYKVAQSYPYPNYTGNENDVMLYKLEKPISFNAKTAPILFKENDGLKINDKAIAIGWAKGNGEPSLVGKPGGETGGCGRFESLEGIVNNFWNGPTGKAFNVRFPNPNSGTRSGDSGGPRVQRTSLNSYTQIGVHSTSDGWQNSQASQISPLYNWISQTSGIEEAKITGPDYLNSLSSYSVKGEKTGLKSFKNAIVSVSNLNNQEITEFEINKDNNGAYLFLFLQELKKLYPLLAYNNKKINLTFKFFYGGSYYNTVNRVIEVKFSDRENDEITLAYYLGIRP